MTKQPTAEELWQKKKTVTFVCMQSLKIIKRKEPKEKMGLQYTNRNDDCYTFCLDDFEEPSKEIAKAATNQT